MLGRDFLKHRLHRKINRLKKYQNAAAMWPGLCKVYRNAHVWFGSSHFHLRVLVSRGGVLMNPLS